MPIYAKRILTPVGGADSRIYAPPKPAPVTIVAGQVVGGTNVAVVPNPSAPSIVAGTSIGAVRTVVPVVQPPATYAVTYQAVSTRAELDECLNATRAGLKVLWYGKRIDAYPDCRGALCDQNITKEHVTALYQAMVDAGETTLAQYKTRHAAMYPPQNGTMDLVKGVVVMGAIVSGVGAAAALGSAMSAAAAAGTTLTFSAGVSAAASGASAMWGVSAAGLTGISAANAAGVASFSATQAAATVAVAKAQAVTQSAGVVSPAANAGAVQATQQGTVAAVSSATAPATTGASIANTATSASLFTDAQIATAKLVATETMATVGLVKQAIAPVEPPAPPTVGNAPKPQSNYLLPALAVIAGAAIIL